MQVLSYAVNSFFPTLPSSRQPQVLVFVNQFLGEANYNKRFVRPQGCFKKRGGFFLPASSSLPGAHAEQIRPYLDDIDFASVCDNQPPYAHWRHPQGCPLHPVVRAKHSTRYLPGRKIEGVAGTAARRKSKRCAGSKHLLIAAILLERMRPGSTELLRGICCHWFNTSVSLAPPRGWLAGMGVSSIALSDLAGSRSAEMVPPMNS